MKYAKDIHFIRHGRTTMNGRYVGSLDIGLSNTGVEQVQRLGKSIEKISFDHIYCSPMLRCRQTLDLLLLNDTYEYLDQLKEVDFGHWEGKSFNEIVKTDKERVDRWAQEPDLFSFPDGESVVDFQDRIFNVGRQLAQSQHQKILIVAHGGVIRYLLCYFLNLSVKNYLVFDVHPGKMCCVKLYSEGGVLTKFNFAG